MPRASRAQMAANRAAMVEAASVLLRERGAVGVTVDAVCARAGLTHGGFYKQFASKEALTREAFDRAAAERRAVTSALLATATAGNARDALVHAYLSPQHRDDPGHGCAVAALVSDTAVPAGGTLRAAYATALQDLVASLSTTHEGTKPDQDLADVALLVGALALARATRRSPLSDAVLEAARTRLSAH